MTASKHTVSAQMTETIAALRRVLFDRAIQRGDFELSSGGTSNYYINCRKASMSYIGMEAIGQAVIQLCYERGLKPTVFAGPEAAGIPLVSAALMVAHRADRLHDGFCAEGCFVRKEQRKHGTMDMIEGYVPKAGDRVLMLEDVVTTGTSVVKALQALQQTGAEIIGVVALVDRLEGAGEKIQQLGIEYTALLDVQTLGLVG